jgi:hypothetical protein
MKTHLVLFSAVLVTTVTVSLFLGGCSTPEEAANRPRRFHEASKVNVVLQFSSWDYTFLVQPRYHENGFLRQVRRESIGQVFDQFQVRRDLAVVVVGWNYDAEQMNRLMGEWKSILGRCGFRRVVFLRSTVDNELNGSLIVDDSTLSFASARFRSLFAEP